jgi:hypothetical protein
MDDLLGTQIKPMDDAVIIVQGGENERLVRREERIVSRVSGDQVIGGRGEEKTKNERGFVKRNA